jgi:hypothetical protein
MSNCTMNIKKNNSYSMPIKIGPPGVPLVLLAARPRPLAIQAEKLTILMLMAVTIIRVAVHCLGVVPETDAP